jgi:hypothetical protein
MPCDGLIPSPVSPTKFRIHSEFQNRSQGLVHKVHLLLLLLCPSEGPTGSICR